MSFTHRLLILLIKYFFISFLFISFKAYTLNVFADALYWRMNETVDWVLNNNLNPNVQSITYSTATFKFKPGFRVGIECETDLEPRFYYTKYHTKTNAATQGNLVSTFLGGKTAQSTQFFFRTGQMHFTLDYNIFDLDFGQKYCATETLTFRPIFGLRAGKIKQKVFTAFQGPISLTESVSHKFRGLGPKIGVESKWLFACDQGYKFSFFSNLTSSYAFGRWTISDVTQVSDGRTIYTNVGSRKYGAFTLEAILGVALEYNCFTTKLGYEIVDWFNQYQVFDDGTGAQHADLILQGITLKISYDF